MDLSTHIALKTQWAVSPEDFQTQTMQISAKPKFSAHFNNENRLTAIGRLFAETENGLKPGDADRANYSTLSRPTLLGHSVELALRELFFEKSLSNNFITIGKQQVVWGKADGLKVLDVVNPQSFREFILGDVEDSRIPLWIVNYEWQIDHNSSLQFLWIPDQTMHSFPDKEATYAFTTPRLVPRTPTGIPVVIKPTNRPSRTFADADMGLRWSAFLGGWDLTVNYLYHYDDFPVLYQRLSITTAGTTIFIEPTYERSHLLGGTFSNSFGDLSIRGEVGYSFNRYFLTTKAGDTDGIAKNDEFSHVLGFDWFGFNDSLLSVQLFQSIIPGAPSGITRPAMDSTLTFLAQKKFFNDTLKVEALILKNLNDNDKLMRPKITYDWQDDVKVWVGADIFYGDKKGLFGQFDNNDRIVLGSEITF